MIYRNGKFVCLVSRFQGFYKQSGFLCVLRVFAVNDFSLIITLLMYIGAIMAGVSLYVGS